MRPVVLFICLLLLVNFSAVSCDRAEETQVAEPRPAEPLTPLPPAPDDPQERIRDEAYRQEMGERSRNKENL
ncbi:MAG: hypothetical protein C4576_00325 [Desulfobacteraceae bacterium]|nr:MAG: hypothetical protein C4576_00325 [Desulfobacteraceae bacterium]